MATDAVETVNQEGIMRNRRGFIPPGRAGFTLLELLMVVIIIAILAAIALPQYLRVAERSRSAEALQLLASIRSSEGRFRAASAANLYTTDLATLDIGVPAATPNWAFTVPAVAAGTNAIATRTAGGDTIQMDLDNGTACTNNTAQYGLQPLAAC